MQAQFVRVAIFLILMGLPGLRGAEPPPADGIAQAFARLYSFDFQGAHAQLDREAASHPDRAMVYSVRAAVDLFSELDRLMILEAELFADDDRLTDKRKLQPDLAVRARFYRNVQAAQERARAALAHNPQDAEAFYSLCMSQGVTVDYAALIERRHLQSLSLAKQSNSCAQRLLAAHPDVHDAYATTGFTEYLAGSLPFFVRWFVKFENVQGSKEKAIENLQIAARSGRYLQPFAKILLAILYLREKKPDLSARMLEEFSREYPDNPLVRRELAKLSLQRGQGPLGQK